MDQNKAARPTHQLIPEPSRKVLNLYGGRSKPHATILIQIRTQRIGIRHFLYKIKASNSEQCCCEEGSRTPRHILLQCLLYIELRKKMLDKIGMGRTLDYDKDNLGS
jgi:hypothetical protein